MNKQAKELVGCWSATGRFASVAHLFYYTSYEEYRQQGFLLVNEARAVRDFVPVMRERGSGPSQAAQLALREDGQFTATNSMREPLPTDGVRTSSTIWSGSWELDEDTLCLHIENKNSRKEGRFSFLSADDNVTNKTFRFTYQIDSSNLRLFPLFDRKDAYQRMLVLLESSEENYASRSTLEQAVLPILSNSQGALTAYTVRQVKEKIEEMKADSASIQPNLQLIRRVVNQWYSGESGLPVEPFRSTPVDKSKIANKWYINGDPRNFILLQHLHTSAGVKEVTLVRNLILPHSPSPVKIISESRLEFDLNKEGTFFYRLLGVYSKPGDTVFEKYTSEYRGVWTLEDDFLTLLTNEFEQITDKSHVTQPTKIKGGLRVRLCGENLCVDRAIMPDSVYHQLKQAVARARENSVRDLRGLSANLSDIFTDAHSPLSAYDAWQVNRLTQQIYSAQRSSDENDKTATNQAYNTIEALIDKWYAGLIREDK